MNKKIRLLALGLCATTLTACSNYQQSSYYTTYQPYVYTDTYYRQGYNGGVDYGYQSPTGGQVTVPDSYYVGAYHSPTSHKDVDRNWVNSQNPQGYTIEVAEGERPAQVAGKLYKLPKNDRRAQIKYNKNGKTYYKGVYGSYNNYEDAQKALNNLPDDVKQSAGVKSWSKVQANEDY
ncbi:MULTISPECIES: SPOR domain-containing protein [Legionella]|uniref:SPOR domain-containing protein n=1 Tax=Legionella TaxID=445 RepID=UPI001E5FC21D|nr:SPOR domain-containing protein [Legionella sp. 31fI33]MCC5013939.1 SPOR domain-containing protein [Legionella sp. 31fI33]